LYSIYSSASELAAAVRRRALSARDVVEQHLERIRRHNPALNAIITLDEEHARRGAREADDSLTRGAPCGPLHGVPFTLKDCHDGGPAGLADNGLPVGIQLVGRRWADERLLATARAVVTVIGRFRAPPRFA